MKKGYLKVLAAVAAVAMLMSMSLSVFADAPTYTTTTTYNLSDETKVDVVTEVTGVGAEDQVAYLVTEKNSTPGNIIWIDQQAADEDGAVTFSFTTDAANAKGLGSEIKVGSTSYAATAFDSAETEVKLANYTVTYAEEVKSGENVIGRVKATVVSGNSVTDGDEIEFTVYPAAGYEFDKCVAVVGSDETELPWVAGSSVKKVAVKANTTYEFSFKAVTATLEVASVVGSATVSANPAGKQVGSVAGSAKGASEFGILVINAESAESLLNNVSAADFANWENATDKNGVRKYQALGANEAGEYVISLVDSTDEFFANGASYKAVLYALKGDSLLKSAVFTLGE